MDSRGAVENLIQATANMALLSPENPAKAQRTSRDEIFSSLVSIRIFLQKAEQDTLDFEELEDMRRLTSSQSIQSFVECRQDQRFSFSDNWPTALLFHLSTHCSNILADFKQKDRTNHAVSRALTAVHLQACLQLPCTYSGKD
jgi:hypothetical protein